MRKECLSFLVPRDGQVFVDATFGSGGHTAAILMSAKCKVYVLDRDPAAIEIANNSFNQPLYYTADDLVLRYGAYRSHQNKLKSPGKQVILFFETEL